MRLVFLALILLFTAAAPAFAGNCDHSWQPDPRHLEDARGDGMLEQGTGLHAPRVIELRADNDWLGSVLDPLLAVHASLARQLKVVSRSVLLAAREDADVRRMMRATAIHARFQPMRLASRCAHSFRWDRGGPWTHRAGDM